MKVYFHSNGALADSPHFNYTFMYPPKGVEYVNDGKPVYDVFLNMQTQRMFKVFSNIGKWFLNSIKRTMVNTSVVPEKAADCDLVHAFNTIPITSKPFIVEMECFHSLFIGGHFDLASINKINKLLSSPKCKKIIFWTQNAYDNFHIVMINPALEKKSIILYPGVPLYVKNKSHRIPTIGFIARNFFDKGGELVLPVMRDFVKSGRAKAVIVTDLNLLEEKRPGVLKEYSKIIRFEQLMPRSELHKKIFPQIDVLFYPGYSDTFGYMFPEAMSHGIPVVTLDGCARRELVHHEKGGYVVWGKLSKFGFLESSPADAEKENVQMLINMVLTNLLGDRKLLAVFSNYNYELVKSGQFSLYNRNEKLKKVYTGALK